MFSASSPVALLTYTLCSSDTELFVVLGTGYVLSSGTPSIWRNPNYLPSLRSNDAPHARLQAFPEFLRQAYVTECPAITVCVRGSTYIPTVPCTSFCFSNSYVS